MSRALIALALLLAACSDNTCKRVCDAGDEDCMLGAPVAPEGCTTYYLDGRVVRR